MHLRDADGDGRWGAGEDVWVDVDRNGVFDPAVDVVLWDGGDEVVQVAAGYAAPVSDVVFTDLDGSGDWNPGEPVWENAAATGVPLSRSGLFVDDRDGDGRWSAGEPVSRLRPGLGPALRRGKGRTDRKSVV